MDAVVIVSGTGGAGKTTIGRALAKRLGYTFYSKDMFKEQLFAEHKRHKLLCWLWYDREAKNQLFDQIARSQAAGESIVAESNFEPRDKRRLQAIIQPDKAVEIFLYARQSTVVRRYLRRLNTGEKHAGHYDWLWVPTVLIFSAADVLGLKYYKPTGAAKTVYRVDTTDFAKVSIEDIGRSVTEYQH